MTIIIMTVIRLGLFSVMLILIGCDQRLLAQQKFEAYVNALNRVNVVDIGAAPHPATDWLPMPQLRDRQQILSEFDISMLEFLSLQRCQLGAVIGHKNSLLGKVMPASQRLLYELEIIRAIETCDIDSVILQSELQQIAKVKRAELSKAFANAMWASEETRIFFSFSNGYIPMALDQVGYDELYVSIAYLHNLAGSLHQLPELTSAVLEHHFSVLRQSEYAGQLLLTLLHASYYLSNTADALEQIALTQTFCDGSARYLKQQFTVHYVEQLQPYLARVSSTAYSILYHLDAIKQLTEPHTPLFERYLNQWSISEPQGAWMRYQRASTRHAKVWSQLLNQCQLGVR